MRPAIIRDTSVSRRPTTSVTRRRHDTAGVGGKRTEQIGGGDGQKSVASGRVRPERRLAKLLPVDITVRDAGHTPGADRGRSDTVAKQRERVLQRSGSTAIGLSLLNVRQAAIDRGVL